MLEAAKKDYETHFGDVKLDFKNAILTAIRQISTEVVKEQLEAQQKAQQQ